VKELLKTLSLECAPSGREKSVAAIIENEIAPYCDSVSYDKLGNLVAVIKPRKKCEKVMVCAHMDEVGFMVRSIDNDGRAHVSLLGAVETRTLSGRRVRFLDGTIGIVSTKPIHVMSANEEERPTYEDRIYIELGAKNRAEAEKLVKIGDFGTFEQKFKPLAGDTVAGKAIGGRACVCALISLIKEAHAAKKAKTLTKECYFVFSVKREIAKKLFAVRIASFNIRPDNTIRDIGCVYAGGVGICVGYVRETRVLHNTLTDLPYTAISFGWGWGCNGGELRGQYYTDEDGVFLFCNNEISYNYISNIMNVLFDGGGIYTLGRNDGTVLTGNYIEYVNNDYGAIYLDDGSVGFEVYDNVVKDSHRNYIYKGDYNHISGNYTTKGTAKAPDYDLRTPLDPAKPVYTFEDNYLWDEDEVARIFDEAGAR
jgi:hypothetical protein